jgi:hypothetical protein
MESALLMIPRQLFTEFLEQLFIRVFTAEA